MTVHEVLEGLRRELARLLAAVDALGPAAETVWVTEPNGWTAKDVLGHLIHYNGQIAFALGAERDDDRAGPPPYVIGVTERLSGQEWNDRAVEYWRGFTLSDVRAEFVKNAEMIEARVATLSDDDLAAPSTSRVPWDSFDRTLADFIGHDTFLAEWPAHAEQIERAASRADS